MTETAAEPRPPRSDTESRMALWERHDATAVRVALVAGRYIEAMDTADQALIDIYWRLLAECSAEHQAVRAALGLTDPKGA